MRRNQFIVSSMIGVTFSATLVLLLNLPNVVSSVAILLLLSPGAMPVALLTGSTGFGPPIVVLIANSGIYAGISYGLILRLGRTANIATVGRLSFWFAIPAATLFCLACTHALNPLWPRGMMGLETEEEFLQDALPKGTGIADARAALRSKGIQFVEEPQARDAVILERKNRHIAAAAGDEVISARAETDAYQFPCGYEIEIVLVFGVDQKLKDKYIDRLQLCP